MKHLMLLIACLLVVTPLSQPSVAEIVVYTNDFEGAAGSEWSHSQTDVTPVGARRFLGQFVNDTVSLTLAGLPQHTTASVSFDLFIIRSWDGNGLTYLGGTVGPDVWHLGVEQGPMLVHSTFCNKCSPNDFPQSYPGSYLDDSFPAQTGATERLTLGYVYNGCGVLWPADSVYRITQTFSHSGPSLMLNFWTSALQAGLDSSGNPDESWGLDNVTVSITPIPEPSSMSALISGVIGLGALAKAQGRRQYQHNEASETT